MLDSPAPLLHGVYALLFVGEPDFHAIAIYLLYRAFIEYGFAHIGFVAIVVVEINHIAATEV